MEGDKREEKCLSLWGHWLNLDHNTTWQLIKTKYIHHMFDWFITYARYSLSFSLTHTYSLSLCSVRLLPCVSFVPTHVLCVCICVGLHKLYQACLISPCSRVCMWFLALLQAHWRLSSHQDVPAGPRLGRVPGLSAACVLAECCQIIPHSWKVAWRRSYPSFTEKA